MNDAAHDSVRRDHRGIHMKPIDGPLVDRQRLARGRRVASDHAGGDQYRKDRPVACRSHDGARGLSGVA